MTSGKMAMSGTLGARVIRAPGPGLAWKVRNLPNVWPGVWRHALARTMGMNHMLGTLHALLRRADGSVVNYGLVSTRLVTTAFCEFMVDELQAETTEWGDFKYHDSGTGVVAAAIGDTGMGTESTEQVDELRGVGTQIEGATAVIYKSVGTIVYDGAGGAITEHGLFSDTRVGVGTLMDRHVFAAINVVAADSIEFTYQLTATAGG